MNDTIIKHKPKHLRLNTEKLFALGAVKAAASAAFGFVTALPIKAIGVSPLAVAAIAVIPHNWAFACYLGGFFSYMTNSFYSSAAPLSAMTALLLFKLLFKGKGKTLSDTYIAPIAVFLSLTVTGILCGDIRLSYLSDSFSWIAISAASAGSAIALKCAVDMYGKSLFKLKPATLASIAAAAFLILVPLGSVAPFGISPLAVVAATSALIFAVKLGGAEAFFAAVFFGTAWATGAMKAEYLFILPACVLAARALFPLGKLPCAAGFIALRFAFNLIFTPINELMPQMIEVLIAALILTAIPQRLLARTSLIARPEPERSGEEQAAKKIKETAALFRYLSDSIADVSAEIGKELTPTPEGCVSHIRETLCAKCELTKFCSGVKKQEVTEGIYRYACDVLKGAATAASLPRCAHLNDMESGIRNYMLMSRIEHYESNELRELSTDSYIIVSEALDELSAEVAAENDTGNVNFNASDCVEIACSQHKNEKETKSGDNCEYFTHGKYLYVIISDGMGSGKIASIDSGMTCGLLKRFMLNGFSFATALKLANAALKLKGGDESFATADVCRLDTSNGNFSIAKAGAAASYLISDNRVRRLYSPTLPVGILNEARYDVVSARLKKGDALIMLSDGAVSNGDEWLENPLFYGMKPSAVCEKIVRTARESYGSSGSDDITAVCIRLK